VCTHIVNDQSAKIKDLNYIVLLLLTQIHSFIYEIINYVLENKRKLPISKKSPKSLEKNLIEGDELTL